MKVGVIADDFTGASDIGLMLKESGFKTIQYVGVPKANVPTNCEAAVISLKSRTINVVDAVSQSLAACEWLLAQGAQQIVFKVCSTFDSTKEGNIGPVTEALANYLGEEHVIVCPSFPENGRSVYQGHLFVGDVLLNESGMQNHPLTPMTNADLRVVLAEQSTWDVRHISSQIVAKGADEVRASIHGSSALYVVDAISNEDLIAIGGAVKGRKLLTGGSGIALGLSQNFAVSGKDQEWTGIDGAGVILSGSCSTATRAQVDVYKRLAPSQELDVPAIMDGSFDLGELVDWVISQEKPPLIYSSTEPKNIEAIQALYGQDQTSKAVEDVFSKLAARLNNVGVSKFIVAGGETSGAVTQGLNATVLEIGPRVAAGVPVLKMQDRQACLVLKSGNFGDELFFERALKVIDGNA